jgi:hypothetical protein
LVPARLLIGFSIVALSDDKQCAAVEAGPIIDLSRRALGADQVPEILTTKRQQTEREREIVGLLREGRAAEALEMKRADGTAEMMPGGRVRVIARVAAPLYRAAARDGRSIGHQRTDQPGRARYQCRGPGRTAQAGAARSGYSHGAGDR